MKSKAKKYFIVCLSVVLILSNFSFASALVFCKMGMGNNNPVCACSNNEQDENSGIVISKVSGLCCETKIVELSNSNILEILHNNLINPFTHSDLMNLVNNISDIVSYHGQWIYNEFSFHPPNSEIPILNSSLLI